MGENWARLDIYNANGCAAGPRFNSGAALEPSQSF
jgi:hypothetical protein